MTKPLRDRAYLDYLRTQRCLFTGQIGGVDPVHIGTHARGVKSPDNEAIPLAHHLHENGHQKGEVSMLRREAPNDVIRAAFRALAREIYRKWKASK